MKLVVDEEVNERIDKYLARVSDYSRETITKMLNNDYILVNGKKVKASYKPVVGDNIEIKDGFAICVRP